MQYCDARPKQIKGRKKFIAKQIKLVKEQNSVNKIVKTKEKRKQTITTTNHISSPSQI